MNPAKDILIAFGLLLISLVYLLHFGRSLPPIYSAAVGLILLPFILGVCGALLMSCPLHMKLIYLLPIPIFHVVYFGGDAAKPGVERFVALLEIGLLWAGVLLTHFIHKFASRLRKT